MFNGRYTVGPLLVGCIKWEFCLLKNVERVCGSVFGLMGEVGER